MSRSWNSAPTVAADENHAHGSRKRAPAAAPFLDRGGTHEDAGQACKIGFTLLTKIRI